MAFVSCSKLTSEVNNLQSQIDALEAGAPVQATTTVAGISELATSAETGAGASTTLVITPNGLATALNDAAGPNALQKAVVNAVEIAITSDTGAQQAIADAIADTIADNLASSPAFAASVAAAETTTTLTQSGTGYVYTNEDAATTAIQAATFLSTAAGQSLSVKPDGGLYVNVIGMLPASSTYSGSTAGNVDIAIVGDGGSPENFTIQGDLNVAANTPTASTNMLKWSASGFYVSAEEISATISSNPTALATLLAALGDPFGL